MPYDCRLEGGRLRLVPSPERSYPIMGLRVERPFTWCGVGGACRVRMLHRFELSCGGARVPWRAVALAVSRTRIATGSGDGNARDDCAAPIGMRRSGVVHDDGHCQRRVARPALELASLPPGFAPLNEVGARILLEQPGRGSLMSPKPAPAPPPAALIEPLVSRLPQERPPSVEVSPLVELPQVEPVRTVGEMAAAEPAHAETSRAGHISSWGGWIVSVEQYRDKADAGDKASAEAAHGPYRHMTGPVILVLLLGTVLAGVGWQRVRRPALAAAGGLGQALVRRSSGALVIDQDERACLDLGRTVEQLIRNADTRLCELEAAAPLRGVLRQELDFIRLRLAESLKIADQPKPNWRLLRGRLKTAIRELHRIVKIAEGAIASFSAAQATEGLPRSREEAYARLGVNADVSETVLKKVVDALRMSWHPDLAKNEEDRLRREERTKAINVAWDLIIGRRGEG